MYPSVIILGKTIPSYWLCALLGIFFCSILLLIRHKDFKELEQVDITNTAALSGIGMIIGGRVLFVITIIPFIVKNFKAILADRDVLLQILSNGIVFYGGLIGALAAMYMYTSRYKLDKKLMFDYFAPAIPLFHAFGRIGCFLTGCCYGIECDHLGIAFSHSEIAPNGVPLFPVQLLGSALELVLFALVVMYEKKHHKEGKAVFFYLLMYSVGRFFVEFIRGDEARGFLLGISTSQWISMMIFAAVIAYITKYKNGIKENGTREQ